MPERREKPVTVVVTGVGGGGVGEQILKALRLAEKRYEIIGTDSSALSKGLASVDHAYRVPAAVDERYPEAMLAICERHAVKAVFVGSEPELRVLSKQRAAFDERSVLLTINPDDVIETCLDKDRTMRFLAANDFSAPRTIRIDEVAHLEAVDFFPVVLKPYVGAGGSQDVSIVQDRDELIALGRYLLIGGRKIIAQEYVGTPEAEFTVGILTSMAGEFINSIALRRFTLSGLGNRLRVPNRTGRQELGELLVVSSGISQGEIGPFPHVTSQCEEIAKALGCRGSVNIQCRYVDGRVVIFEINPRFSGTTSLRAMVGYNEPDVLVREHILGERVERRFSYRSGVILRGLDETLLHDAGAVPVTDA